MSSTPLDTNGPLRVTSITLEGNVLTKPQTVERCLQGLYSATTIESVARESLEAAKSLEELGIFDKVDLCMNPGKNPGEAILAISLKEKRILSLKGTTFIEQGEAGVEVNVRALNPLGNAESFEVSALMGGNDVKSETPKRSLLQASYMQPQLFGLPLQLVCNADTAGHRPLEAPFEELSFGTLVKLRSQLLGVDVFWTARQRDLVPLSIVPVPEEILAQCLPSLKSAVGLHFSDNEHALHMELASPGITGGNVSLFSLLAKVKRSVEILPDIELVASLEAGICRSLHEKKSVHLADRLFLGGPLFLRGFNPRGAGPRGANGGSLGGNNRWQARLGLEGPFPYLPLHVAKSHVFLNGGALSNVLSFKSLCKSEVRVSCGVGMAMNMSGIRLEANLVYPLWKQRGDVLSPRLQVGVGGDFL